MSKNRNVWVVTQENGWAVKKEGIEHPLSTHRTQSAAIEEARTIAQANHSELFIQGRDGRIRDRDSYGNDPFPPKDTKH
jgi:hypothetical protein